MRKLLIVLLILCGASAAHAQTSAFYPLRPPQPNTTVRVCPVPSGGRPCPAPSSIFSDQALSSPVTNPFTTGPDGNFGFWAAPGQYTIQLSGQTTDEFIITLGGGGGGGGGSPPVGNAGDIQSTTAGHVLQATGLNDNGTRLKVNRDEQPCGPNPYKDVRCFGVRATNGGFSTTGSITAGTNTLSLASASSFINGDGILVGGAGPAPSMTTPSAPTVVASNASLLPGTGVTVANSSGGSPYDYQIDAIDQFNGATIASAITHIANGAATLGYNSVNVSSWTRVGGLVTVTTASAHNLVVGSLVSITTDSSIAGTWQVATVPDSTHFTYGTSLDARNNALTVGGSGGVVAWYTCNHITWTAVAGAWKYLIYGRVSGSMTLIGVSYPENTNSQLHSDPLYNNFDDFGSVISGGTVGQAWYPATPPVAVKNQDLSTTITSGGGTTSLVLAANATNTVSGATTSFDNAPNIVAAANAAVTGGTSGVLFFPQTLGSNNQYFVSSILNLNFFPSTLSVMQAGTITLGDTMILGSTTWTGSPKIPTNAPQFSFEGLPNLFTGGNPAIYSNNAQTNMSYVSINGNNANQALLWLNDLGGGIPASRWEHMSFATSGSNDCLGRGIVIRNNLIGGAFVIMNTVSFTTGSCPVPSNAPVFQHTQNGGAPWTLTNIFLNRRGMYFGGGFQGTIDTIYEQGAVMPKLTFANTLGGTVAIAADLRNSIEDTTNSQVITYFGGLSGYIRFIGSNGVPNGPVVSGVGGVAINFEGVGTGLGNGQNTNAKIGPITGQAVDGTFGTGGNNSYPEQIYHMSVSIGSPYKWWINSLAQLAPTCVVSSGGSITTQAYNFNVTPTFADGSEGVMSPLSTTCTATTGNQTITISWSQVPGATGYNLYENNRAFQCVAPFITSGGTLSYVWNSFSPCGGLASVLPGGGPVSGSVNALQTPKLNISAGNGGGFVSITMPTATANRSQNSPDATGTFLLDSTLLTSAQAAPFLYDNFNRANNPIGTGAPVTWTIVNGTVTVASNAANFTTASVHNIAVVTSPAVQNDQFAEGTLSSASGATYMVVRGSNSAQNGYICVASGNIERLTGGSTTSIGSAGTATNAGDTIRCEAQGTTIRFFTNGVLNTSATDATYATGFPGIGQFSNAGITIDNFTAGNITDVYTPLLHAENNWSQPQHFLGPVTIGTPAPIPGTLNPLALYLGTSGGLTGASGNGATVVTTTGTQPSGDVVVIDANGNHVDGGTPGNLAVKWSSLQNPSTSLTLSMSTAISTFNYTVSTTLWTLANITAATSGTSQSSPGYSLCGTYWTGSASAADCWTFQDLVSNGTNGASTLKLSQNGSTGTASVLVPQLGVGGTPPTCIPGTSGAFCLNLGTAPSAGSTWSNIYADGTQNAASVNNANTGNAVISRSGPSGCISVVPVTVSANVTTDQNLMTCTLNANLLNVAGRTLKIFTAGVYSTAATSTAQMTLKYKLCTVSGCGSGTVVTLINIQTIALASVTVTNNAWNVSAYSTTQTAGASSAYEAHGSLSIDLGSLTTAADSIFNDVNTATQSAIDSTGQLFLQITGAFSTASASNSFTQRQLVVEVLN